MTYLLNSVGNGNFIIQLQQPDGRLVKEFQFAVGKQKGAKSFGSDDSSKSGGYSSQILDTVKAVAEIFKGQSQGGNGSKDIVEAVKAVSELTKDSRDMQTEMMSILLQNALSERNSPIQELREIMEFSRTLQPQVQHEDGLTALLQTGLTSLLASQGGSNPLAAISALGKMATPPGQGQVQATPLASTPPAQIPEAQQDHRVVPQQQAGSQASGPAPEDPQTAFYNLTILPFRRAVTAGATPEQLGNLILGILGTAKQWTPSNPHPLVAELVNAVTPTQLSAGFDTFCSAIPELKSNAELQGKIKDYLGEVLKRSYGQELEPDDVHSADPGGETEPDQDRADSGEDGPTESDDDDPGQE